jgi:cell division protein FtsB
MVIKRGDMRFVTYRLLVIGLICELALLSYFYCYGRQGYHVYQYKCLRNTELLGSINSINSEITQLENDVEVWKTDAFCKEKVAREKLQMARKDDLIYFI